MIGKYGGQKFCLIKVDLSTSRALFLLLMSSILEPISFMYGFDRAYVNTQ